MTIRLALDIAGWLWDALAFLWIAAMFTNKRAVRRLDADFRLLRAALSLTAFWLMLFYYPPQPWPWLAHRLFPRTLPRAEAGLALVAVGIAFAIWARVYLGRNWSGSVQVKQDHKLITGGPYSLVRHPIYTGLLLAFAGTALQHGEVRCFIALPLLAISWWMKLRSEERFMTDQFGQQYAAYRARTKALVPWVV